MYPNYSIAQKIAVIDNAIGKRITYTPDAQTEVYDEQNHGKFWRAINSGYGICLDIAEAEQYMLKRIGVESELVFSEEHIFLKIKDIELPDENGVIRNGNTILDPTWNLQAHKFGGKPNNFFKSYDEIRKNDIDENGVDHLCHKNDKALNDANLNLDEKNLRELFKSVGLTDKNGDFPIKEMLEQSVLIHETYANQPSENIKQQFLLLSKTFPEFYKWQTESKLIIKLLLSDGTLKFNKSVVGSVYDRKDIKKRSILYYYIDSDELGKKFYYVDKVGNFIELSEKEFTDRFECYDEELKLSGGCRPWEKDNKPSTIKSSIQDLNGKKSSNGEGQDK